MPAQYPHTPPRALKESALAAFLHSENPRGAEHADHFCMMGIPSWEFGARLCRLFLHEARPPGHNVVSGSLTKIA